VAVQGTAAALAAEALSELSHETAESNERAVALFERALGVDAGFAHSLDRWTGVVPDESFSLEPGDVVEVESPKIGRLRNPCASAEGLPVPAD
jgi:2-keto-4-pentenoate hydratase/2-oxohepta-3-ene-1,7-dioic acid hydratase in catechol pathway